MMSVAFVGAGVRTWDQSAYVLSTYVLQHMCYKEMTSNTDAPVSNSNHV